MSDEAIEAIADALLDADDDGVDELEDRAEYVLDALRAAGFELYRPEGCPLVDYWQDTPDDKVALVDGDGRRIYGAGIPDGRYRLVPVEAPKEDSDA